MEKKHTLNAKERILEAASKLFIENGYKGTTSRMIAKEAGVNLGLLPYYFEKKENIAIEIYSKCMGELKQKIDYEILNIENSIEYFFFIYIMLQYHMNQEPGLMKMYLEILKDDIMQYSIEEHTIQSLEMIERDYNLQLGENDIAMALYIIKGVERSLMLGGDEGKIELNDYIINVEVVKCALLYLGIERELIERSIESVELKMKNANIDFHVFQVHM